MHTHASGATSLRKGRWRQYHVALEPVVLQTQGFLIAVRHVIDEHGRRKNQGLQVVRPTLRQNVVAAVGIEAVRMLLGSNAKHGQTHHVALRHGR